MPTSLQGLNIVYPSTPLSDNQSQDLLTPPPGFPDLSAQLDLWTNLSFASDEPFVPNDRKEREYLTGLDQPPQEGDRSKDFSDNNHGSLVSPPDNLVLTTNDNTILSIPRNKEQIPIDINGTQGPFDLGSFLAGFGIDPFLVPPQPSPILSSTDSPNGSMASPSDISPRANAAEGQPPMKRTRTHKVSSASQVPSVSLSVLQQSALNSDTRGGSEFSDDHDPLSTPLTASEDKRRRNTAASARFRAKKKEREQAMEKRSKELETKVTELERECEGLRRENGWLKGLVVGVTGGSPSGVPSGIVDSGPGDTTAAERKVKRKREPEE